MNDDQWRTVFRRSPEFDQTLARLKVFIGDPNRQTISIRAGVAVAPYTQWQHPDEMNSMGFASYCMGGSGEIDVGNYCSIAGGLNVMGERHPIEFATSSSLHYDNGKPHFAALIRDFNINWEKAVVPVHPYAAIPVIGHDVWIGANVTLARAISIGTGAVIAANSVVTKDVAPYDIVGGNPAKLIRKRFPDKSIDGLLKSVWWEYANVIGVTSMRGPDEFLESFQAALNQGVLVRAPTKSITRDTIKEQLLGGK